MTYWALVATYYTIDLYRRHQQSSVLTARLQARASGLQLRAVEAQVRALRMELNPHFLYNTLNSVGAFVRTDQNAAALQMLARLGDLLRGTLDRDLGPETPLGNELELLQRYLDIELVRFSDRLAIEVDVPDEIRGAMVPSFMLQPLVENAIRHGIGGRSGPGTIRITGRRHAESLALAVQDDGIGLGDVSGAGDGIGLSNTRARLEQLYGDAGRLVLRDAASGGAIAEVTLPFRRDQERNRSNGSDTQR
jgi:LytS/YehU family sensor histidine kinase